ncbi:MAG: hypothetical protein GC192_24670 [Bacteroidetes bacterium]|nr:hypothetical protein [Bacteroidota bacterium]
MKKLTFRPRHFGILFLSGLILAAVISIGLYVDRGAPPPKKPMFSSLGLCGSGVLFDLSPYDSTKAPAPLFSDMGNFHYEVNSASAKAKQYFDQGLKLVYGFNHSEAHRAFSEAARIDSNFVMAYWGQALALGPNINDPAPDKPREQAAYEAIQKALKISRLANKKEQDFVAALATRHADSTTVDREALNIAYAKAMKSLAQKYPDDDEAQTLYADAIMNTMPWDYYYKDKTPKPATNEVVAVLEKVIARDWNHPGAHHLYIHIVEPSKTPDRGVPSADVLGSLIPAAGHLVHMPSHIYIRVGRYTDAYDCNKLAIEKDEDYIAHCQAQGLYPLGYYPHNIHFVWAAATLLGKSQEAIAATEKTARRTPVDVAAQVEILQYYLIAPMESYVRFGKWNDILTTPAPSEDLVLVSLYWHYARGVAFVKKGLLDKVEPELAAINDIFEKTKKGIHTKPDGEPKEEPLGKEDSIKLATMTNLVSITQNIVSGEMAANQGKYSDAIQFLEKAKTAESDLPYNEPETWHHPVRQILGAVQLKAGQAKNAEQSYREDLDWNRNNGWSLFGLYQSLKAQGKDAEAKATWQKFKEAWAEADVELTASSF